MRISKRNLAIVSLIVSLFAILVVPFFVLDLRINTTASFPLGLYKVVKNTTVTRGVFVEICAPDKKNIQLLKLQKENDGICSNGTIPLLKKVAAMEGDKITVTNSKVFVNGVEQANSTIYAKKVRYYAQTQTLQKGEIFVMSDYNPMSYDSRYFGALKAKDILHTLTPFFTFQPTNKDFK